MVLTALAKNPQDRYTGAAAMRAALLDALGRVPQREVVHAPRLPPDGGTTWAGPASAATVLTGLPATLARSAHGLSRATAAWAVAGYVLFVSPPMDDSWPAASRSPGFGLYFLLMVGCCIATLNRRARLPAAAGVFGATAGWGYMVMMELAFDHDGTRTAASLLCGLAMTVTAGAIAVGGGLTMSPVRFTLGLLVPLAIIGMPFAVLGIPPGRIAVVVGVACVLQMLVLGLAASFRSRWTVVSAVAGP